jgi:hypothetical protein
MTLFVGVLPLAKQYWNFEFRINTRKMGEIPFNYNKKLTNFDIISRVTIGKLNTKYYYFLPK